MGNPACTTCEGEGRVANTPDREPWSVWENLPPGPDLAVRAGVIRPVPCPDCTPILTPVGVGVLGGPLTLADLRELTASTADWPAESVVEIDSGGRGLGLTAHHAQEGRRG